MLVLYTRPGCLFCKQVEELFVEERLKHKVVQLTNIDRQNELLGPTGAKSFPLIFLNDKFVGGFTHVVHLHSHGRLHELLAESAVGEAEPTTDPPKPLKPTSPVSAVSAAFDEVAGFAKWGEYLKNKRKQG